MRNSITSTSSRKDVYQIITDKVVGLLEQGTVPWKKPWKGGAAGMPKNAVSHKPYRGVNVFMLSITADSMGYNSSYWLTYKQAESLGGNVRQGEKSTLVVFWKWLEKEQTDPETGQKRTENIPMLKYYRVFNADQCENITIPNVPIEDNEPLDFEPIAACENIVDHMPHRPEITHSGQAQAYYRPSADLVHMPEKEKFMGVEEYYSTLFHELTHSTAHESRLDRKDSEKLAAFGSADYSKEELVAEMGAAFLCGYVDIENKTIDNSAAYIQGWLKRLRNDKRLVVHAAAQAQKAVDCILGE